MIHCNDNVRKLKEKEKGLKDFDSDLHQLKILMRRAQARRSLNEFKKESWSFISSMSTSTPTNK